MYSLTPVNALLFLGLSIAACTSSPVAPLQVALKTAQCRATCRSQFSDLVLHHSDASCHDNKECLMCWETCDLLASNFPIWGRVCDQPDLCSEGCQVSCDWDALHKTSSVPLSQHNSRLTLVFSGTRAQWTLTWAKEAPREHVVYALFTRTQGNSWKLKLQTSELGTDLKDLLYGSEIKLVAVAESGVMSVIITPYTPPLQMDIIARPHGLSTRTKIMIERTQDNAIYLDAEEAWPLHHKAEVKDSGLVAAHIWWEQQNNRGGDYLVTWEVESGGLKGSLYTDLPEVDLTLWPETIYKVQVELMTGPLGQTLQSSQLILDTHNITLVLQAQAQREYEERIIFEEQQRAEEEKVKAISIIPVETSETVLTQYISSDQVEIILGIVAGIVAAILVLVFIIWMRKRRHGESINYDETSDTSSQTWGIMNRALSDPTIDESCIIKKQKLSECKTNQSIHSKPTSTPTFTLPPHQPHSSLITLSRPHHQAVNLYTDVPPLNTLYQDASYI